MSKVLVLDLDETLRSLETSNNGNDLKVVLRPQIKVYYSKEEKETDKYCKELL